MRNQLISTDGTRKFVFQLPDGQAIESVGMVMPKNHTLCISTQIGCPVGCAFCSTGNSGYVRDLHSHEIIAQIRSAARAMHTATGTWPQRIVFMGMGEPLLNFANIVHALQVLTGGHGPHLSWRKIIVSTIGIPDRLRALAATRLALPAISLHAPNQALRDKLIPRAKLWPLSTLMPILRDYPLPGRERIIIEYVLIRDVNDDSRLADDVHALLRGIRAKINLIPCNPGSGSPFQRPLEDTINRFADRLRNHGQTVFIRRGLGADILAACGQLHASDKAKSILAQTNHRSTIHESAPPIHPGPQA